MKKGVLIILTTLFFAFSCSEETLNNSFELNKLQTFIPGITYHLENTETTFRINDVNDSRCPKGATCIWAGMVQIELIFQSLATDTIRLNTMDNQSDTIENYVFQLMEVEPYPELDKEINLDDYRITLNIFNTNSD
jgi:hypothetical protein